MSDHDTTSDDYRAGYLAGYTDRQAEVERLESDADRFYRAAYGEERRIPGQYVTRAELVQPTTRTSEDLRERGSVVSCNRDGCPRRPEFDGSNNSILFHSSSVNT